MCTVGGKEFIASIIFIVNVVVLRPVPFRANVLRTILSVLESHEDLLSSLHLLSVCDSVCDAEVVCIALVWVWTAFSDPLRLLVQHGGPFCDQARVSGIPIRYSGDLARILCGVQGSDAVG